MLKELIEHFPRPERGGSSGSRGDPLLIWQFYDEKSSIRTENKWGAARREWTGGSTKGGRKGGRLLFGEDEEEEENLSESISTISLSLLLFFFL